jgi:hypothetical protein
MGGGCSWRPLFLSLYQQSWWMALKKFSFSSTIASVRNQRLI